MLFAHGNSRLALPVTLKQHLAWRSGLLWLIVGVVFVGTELIFGCAFLADRTDPRPATPAIMLLIQEIVVGTFVGILLLMALAARQRVDVTEEGLRVRRSGFSRWIRWTDARLFALAGTSDFELAGTHQIVRFSRLESADLVRPTIPFANYTQQMDLLISLGRKAYPSDLSQGEWALLEPLVPAPKRGGATGAVESTRDRQRHFG